LPVKNQVQILIEDKLIAPYVYAEIKEEDFRGLKSEPIFNALSDFFKNGKELNFYEFKDKIAPPLLSNLSQILQEKDRQATLGEALDCLYSLRQISLEKKSRKLKAEIEKLERKGEKEKLRALLNQRLDITKQLLSLRQRNIKKMSLDKRENTSLERS